MRAYIDPPGKIPLFLRFGIWISEKITGKKMLVARILSWYPRAALGSAVLESLVTHHDKMIDERMLKLLRMQASFATACPFCMDMNSFEYEKLKITAQEYSALKKQGPLAGIDTFSVREMLAIEYARLISQTPLGITEDFMQSLRTVFQEREIVILATTVAQVNYWARLCSALGVPPAGFTETCKLD